MGKGAKLSPNRLVGGGGVGVEHSIPKIVVWGYTIKKRRGAHKQRPPLIGGRRLYHQSTPNEQKATFGGRTPGKKGYFDVTWGAGGTPGKHGT